METTPKEAKEVTQLKDEIQKEAEKQLFQVFPRKIADLGKALQGEMLDTSNLAAIHSDPMIPVSPLLENGYHHTPASEDDLNSVTKERHFEDDVDRLPELGKRPPYLEGMVPGNAKVQAIIHFIKPEILAMTDSCNSLKIWIQLLTPKIEDGNNFGVSVQEEVMKKVCDVQSRAEKYRGKISKYFHVRAKIVSKIAKYPQLADYRHTLNEYDEKFFLYLKVMVTELRGMYALLYDIIIKNYEKLNKPRTSNAHSMY